MGVGDTNSAQALPGVKSMVMQFELCYKPTVIGRIGGSAIINSDGMAPLIKFDAVKGA